MSSENGDTAGSNQVWDGYSDYATVASRIGENVFDAIDAYADVHSAHREQVKVRNQHAAQARASILSAAMSLEPELEAQRDRNEDIDAILKRWRDGGGADDIEITVPAEGFLRAFNGVSLMNEDPEWLYQFVVDIRRAGWELGYLKAGRYEADGPRELEPRDVNKMLES